MTDRTKRRVARRVERRQDRDIGYTTLELLVYLRIMWAPQAPSMPFPRPCSDCKKRVSTDWELHYREAPSYHHRMKFCTKSASTNLLVSRSHCTQVGSKLVNDLPYRSTYVVRTHGILTPDVFHMSIYVDCVKIYTSAHQIDGVNSRRRTKRKILCDHC